MRNWFIGLLIIILQSTIQLHASVKFRHLTTEDGLTDLRVNKIYKDANGLVYIGTDYAVNCFDGFKFSHLYFPDEKSEVRNNNRVFDIVRTDEGSLYIANRHGLWVQDNHNDSLRQIAPTVINTEVWTLASDGTTLFAGASDGLYVVTADLLQHICPSNRSAGNSNKIFDSTFDEKNNTLWLSSVGGLYKYGGATETIQFYPLPESFPKGLILNQIEQLGSTLYIGTYNLGLLEFDINTQTYSIFKEIGSNGCYITSISSNGKDKVCVSVDNKGIYVIDHNSHSIKESLHYNPEALNGISSNNISTLMIDDKDDLWVGTINNGLDFELYQDKLFSLYKCNEIFDSEGKPVRAFTIEDDKKIIGTRNGLYVIDEKSNSQNFFGIKDLDSENILSIAEYKGLYYIGTYGGGVSVLSPNLTVSRPAELIEFDKALHYGIITKMTVDEIHQDLWIATDQGLFRYNADSQATERFDEQNSSLPSRRIQDILFDHKGRGWIATDQGLCIYDYSSNSIAPQSSFPNDFFYSVAFKNIYEDKQHNILFVPESGAICKTNTELTEYTDQFLRPIQPNSDYQNIIEDADNNYWITFADGFMFYNPTTRHKRYFSFVDGLSNCNFNKSTLFFDKDSTLWIANANGLEYISHTNQRLCINQEETAFKPEVSDVQINGCQLSAKQKRDFSYADSVNIVSNNTSLTFRIITLNYTQVGAMSYEYMLENCDQSWNVQFKNNNIIFYNNLKPGTYKLHVRELGRPSSEVTKVFTIKKGDLSNTERMLILIAILIVSYIGTVVYKLKHADKLKGDNGHKYKNVNISDQAINEIIAQLEDLMSNKKPYTNTSLKIADLADALNCKSQTLSYIFTQKYNSNFSDYVNKYRIDHFKEIIKVEDLHNYTIEALASLCGFNSRVSFFRAFKKIEGCTPTDYIKQQKK